MNQENERNIKKLLIATAAYYGQTLTDMQLQLYTEDLSDLPAESVAVAVKQVRLDPKQTRFPLPAMLRQQAGKTDNPEAEAIEASSRIVEAITKIGYDCPKEAENFVGELGWLIVQRQGGWKTLCENTLSNQIPTLKAQWRELGKSLYYRAKQGKLNEAPALPKAPQDEPRLIQLVSNVGKRISK